MMKIRIKWFWNEPNKYSAQVQFVCRICGARVWVFVMRWQSVPFERTPFKSRPYIGEWMQEDGWNGTSVQESEQFITGNFSVHLISLEIFYSNNFAPFFPSLFCSFFRIAPFPCIRLCARESIAINICCDIYAPLNEQLGLEQVTYKLQTI